jgi:hypothetical protein
MYGLPLEGFSREILNDKMLIVLSILGEFRRKTISYELIYFFLNFFLGEAIKVPNIFQ